MPPLSIRVRDISSRENFDDEVVVLPPCVHDVSISAETGGTLGGVACISAHAITAGQSPLSPMPGVPVIVPPAWSPVSGYPDCVRTRRHRPTPIRPDPSPAAQVPEALRPHISRTGRRPHEPYCLRRRWRPDSHPHVRRPASRQYQTGKTRCHQRSYSRFHNQPPPLSWIAPAACPVAVAAAL